MDNTLLERYYEKVVLPFYEKDVDVSSIAWKEHGKVGLDTWAHYFDDPSGREFVLLYEDFPGNEYMSDELTHEIVLASGESTIEIRSKPERSVENLLGFFSLYREK